MSSTTIVKLPVASRMAAAITAEPAPTAHMNQDGSVPPLTEAAAKRPDLLRGIESRRRDSLSVSQTLVLLTGRLSGR